MVHADETKSLGNLTLPFDCLPESNVDRCLKQITFSMSSESKPTRSSRLTGTGRSAIAVILIWGEQASEVIADLFQPATGRPFQYGEVRYGTWIGSGASDHQAEGESVVLVPLASDRFEIHCHGGKAAAERIQSDLDRAGIEPSSPRMTDVAGSIGVATDSIEQSMLDEAVKVLTRCQTTTTAAIALDQVRGALVQWRRRAIESLESQCRESADGQGVASAREIAGQIAGQAAGLARAGQVTCRLPNAIEVVLCGPPNVGKSSLINAMVGYDRSITMDLEGTTRDVLDVETAYRGWPLRLRDTAGLHAGSDAIERHGIDHAMAAVHRADTVVLVSQPGRFADRELIPSGVRVIEVLNKSDLDDAAPDGWMRTVATENRGVETLLDRIVSLWTADLPPAGQPVPISPRQQDWIRSVAKAKDDPPALLQRLKDV